MNSNTTSSRPLSPTLSRLSADAKKAGFRVRRDANALSIFANGEKVSFPLTGTGAIDFNAKRVQSVVQVRKQLSLV